jgi:flagellar FliJ protein
MPGRRFRLESVLQYRAQLVEMRQQELAVLQSRLEDELARLARLHQQTESLAAQIRARQNKGALDCEGLRSSLGAFGRAAQRVVEQMASVAQIEQQTAAKRLELSGAMQDKQVLEKLKERQLAEEQQATIRQEAEVLNEMAVLRFHRAKQEGGASPEDKVKG